MDYRKPPLLADLPPFARLIFSALLVICCFSALFLLGIVAAIPLFGLNLTDMMDGFSDVSDPAALPLLEYFQFIQAVGMFLIPPLLAGWLFTRNSPEFLKLSTLPRSLALLFTFFLMFTCLPLINWLITLNESMTLPAALQGVENWMKDTEEEAARLTEAFMDMPTFAGFLFNMLMIGVLPAVGEELLFRGLFQRLLKDWLGNIHVAIFISAFFFSAMHLQFYGFLPRMALGVMFGYLFWWSGSLWTPIFAHFINNGSAVLFSWLDQAGIWQVDYETFGATDNMLWIALSALAIALFLWGVWRVSQPPANSDLP